MVIVCHSVHPVERRYLPVKNSVNTVERLLNNLLLHQLYSAIPAPVSPAPFYPRQHRKPSGGSGKTMVIAGIIVVLVIIAGVYFIGLP